MAQINSIRELFFEKGLTYAEIARTTGHDVKTVKKYIMMGNFNEPLPKPRQVRGSKLDVYKSQIDEWLEQDKQERRKQRHTAKRVFELLAEKHPDFDCSYRLVARYVSKRKKEIYGEPDKFYMPLVHMIITARRSRHSGQMRTTRPEGRIHRCGVGASFT